MAPKEQKPIVEIVLDEHGMGSVLFDGHNIARAARKTTVIAEAGRPPYVQVELWAHHVHVTAPVEVIAEIREAMSVPQQDIERIADLVIEHLRDGFENEITERVLKRMMDAAIRR